VYARRLSLAAMALTGSLIGSSASAGALAMIPPIEEPAVLTDVPTPRTVRLAWFDPGDAVPGAFGSIEDETAAIFQGMGLSTHWRRAADGDLARMDEVSVIVVAYGARAIPGREIVVMGSTPTADRNHRAVWIHAPNVLAVLGLPARATPSSLTPRERSQFTRALARVIVHEVIHAVAPEVPHGGGLMCGQLNAKQLTADLVEIEPAVRASLYSALGRAPFFSPPRRAEGGAAAVVASSSTKVQPAERGGSEERALPDQSRELDVD